MRPQRHTLGSSQDFYVADVADEEFYRLEGHIGLLAKSIVDIALEAGIINARQPLGGPEILRIADDIRRWVIAAVKEPL
jgi:hypothetical protein